ncbi:dienelactone hydrolase family protein [Bordetella genomosp. 12]|uniref:Carboxymethylenebutenolidase n=1 Tax=Bordetella genomosp. 12 TaxID=463035 RepID=A0A261VC83_9BORD|nr:dienelactone hydrolase family protein [Bordetella genomosp. 12]OZI71180.1 carboxymethylenebutenolidase [Bordetella genomosp. 12]
MVIKDAEFDSLLPPLTLNRRGFIATGLAAGFSLAAGPAVAQTAIKTGSQGLVAGPVEIPTNDGKMPAYRAAPQGRKDLPTLLVVSEIFGVHEYIQDVCRRLAHQGYLAIAPELFARQGDPAKYSDMASLRAEIIDKVPDAQVMADLDATATWAAAHGGAAARLGILGFCWGGRVVWLYAAHRPGLRAGAAWYGQLGGASSDLKPRTALDVVPHLQAPVLGAYGGKDAGIPVADVDRMRVALAKGPAAAQASRIDIYPNAPHAFHADYRPSFHKAEAEQAWQRMLDWFKQNGL